MAETKRMTAEQVVSYLLEEDGVDFLRESLLWVVQQLMEAEVSELIGAERGERSEERLAHALKRREEVSLLLLRERHLRATGLQPILDPGRERPAADEPEPCGERGHVALVDGAAPAGAFEPQARHGPMLTASA